MEKWEKNMNIDSILKISQKVVLMRTSSMFAMRKTNDAQIGDAQIGDAHSHLLRAVHDVRRKEQ